MLDLPGRSSLGVVASPKGWFCGSITLYNAKTGDLVLNGRELDVHGIPITPATYGNSRNLILGHANNHNSNNNNKCRRKTNHHSNNNHDHGHHPHDDDHHDKDDIKQRHQPLLRIESDAKCILVIEKEGIYTRLSEDKFFSKYYPCILVTGKGNPDVATRRLVHRLQRLLKIPALGLCDCNPYGISVLNTYQYEQGVHVAKAKRKKLSKTSKTMTKRKRTRINHNNHHHHHQRKKQKPFSTEESAMDGPMDDDDDYDDDDYIENNCYKERVASSRPALELQWIGLRPSQIRQLNLPPSVFQQLTKADKKRLESLLDENHPFAQQGWNPQQRREELLAMKRYKVELEALHWLGIDYMCKFIHTILEAQEAHELQQRLSDVQGDGTAVDLAPFVI
jgi:hypothetical protein